MVLAINDKDSVGVSKEFLNIVMDDEDKDSVDASNESLNVVIALRAQASAALRSEESRLSGKNRRASREEKPVSQ